jgi:high-affinity Fe2+/Pb2+ permease
VQTYIRRISVNIQNRKSRRRSGQATVRIVFGLGAVTSGVLAYLLADGSRVDSIVLPGIVMGLVVFGVAIYRSARSRQEWSAAWDAYANAEASRGSFDGPVKKKYSHGRTQSDRVSAYS